ncbi:MAG: alpha-amylase, partial [Anaerolineales bacterium]|nr:alpha-amylase [Anaerolineales bacterium]
MEFHVSRKARDHYHFDKSLFSLNGNVIFADFHAARIFTKKINDKRNLIEFPESAVKSGEIAAIGLIDEILHYIFLLYRKHIAPEVLGESLNTLKKIIGEEKVEETLKIFCKYFPPINVYLGNQSVNDYLNDQTEGISNRLITLEELIMLWLANSNPALTSYVELFDDTDLAHQSAYNQIIQGLKDFFKTQPPFGPRNQSLIDMLSEPAIQSPHSIEGQLEYIRQNWGHLLGNLLFRILKNLDLIKEEQKNTLSGPGPAHVLDFLSQSRSGLLEEERFSPDQEWMPKLVLIAKNTYVWLDQLSKHYQRSIHRLDQIPDEALDQLAEWGFTGLWLIGLWERSSASKKIKQFCGNQDAVSSAYSLYDYVIAEDLGGEEAYQQLRSKAWKRGIRLAADMVPNHVGIYSKWIIEHPDWFIYTNYCPFPAYTFNGANLSEDPRVEIKIEDHYYDKKDAAVVFKRTDLWTGDTKFIYHGNDGTSMPWNDTAQLNYLNPQVREAVIQTILHVARKFPIIRFDAAMTLTKKHYQRLWFPEPGSGGDIPSRSEFGMTKEQFDKAMPHEFWREVVDRVAAEIPDTLLLAEAFWLMEGYFVRTLGMHRVYNSAFMNMLRDEKNAEYRQLIKNTLEFDPQILKRYVNFMNNPDEETAVAQFGKDDKYFGICTLLVTLPGLPMFGHGQIEGLTEKYGME